MKTNNKYCIRYIPALVRLEMILYYIFFNLCASFRPAYNNNTSIDNIIFPEIILFVYISVPKLNDDKLILFYRPVQFRVKDCCNPIIGLIRYGNEPWIFNKWTILLLRYSYTGWFFVITVQWISTKIFSKIDFWYTYFIIHYGID